MLASFSRVDPRLQDGARGGLVDAGSRFASSHVRGRQGSPSLHRGQTLVPQLDGASSGGRDASGQIARPPGRRTFAAAHVERQADDEPLHVLGAREAAQSGDESAWIAPVEHPAGMSQKSELVIDGQSDANGPRIHAAGAAPVCSHGSPALARDAPARHGAATRAISPLPLARA